VKGRCCLYTKRRKLLCPAISQQASLRGEVLIGEQVALAACLLEHASEKCLTVLPSSKHCKSS
jgi:hypothetical protein